MVDYAGARAVARRRRRAAAAAEVAPLLGRLDWILLGTVAGSVAYGLWLISGITHADWPGDPHHYLVRQLAAAIVGTIGYLVLLFVDPSVYQRYRKLIYAGTLGVMVLVFLAGAAARGSKRWITFGSFQFQPSEFGKLLFVLFLAAVLAERGRGVSDARAVLGVIGLALLPIGLVFLQPDFGTALVYSAALAAVLFLAGTRWLHLTVLGALAVGIALSVLWLIPSATGHPVLKQYQQDRLTSFLHPDRNPQGLNYNIRQSITAVGAGGTNGRGVAGATQTKYDYLPEHATDFAFASLAEERGFLGAAALLLLYLLIVWRGLKAVTLARDAFSAIAAGGIVFAFLFQVFVNVGGTIGIAPITGIPLPFVSVGGSAMVANLLAMGVLQAISARGRRR
jgi:rod shape determining protein RodA